LRGEEYIQEPLPAKFMLIIVVVGPEFLPCQLVTHPLQPLIESQNEPLFMAIFLSLPRYLVHTQDRLAEPFIIKQVVRFEVLLKGGEQPE